MPHTSSNVNLTLRNIHEDSATEAQMMIAFRLFVVMKG